MAIKYLKPKVISGKTVLLRVDVNEGVDLDGQLLDDFRIKAVLPTMELLLGDKNRLIVCGHLGRPKGEWEESHSLRPVAKRLAELLNLKFVETDKTLPDYPSVGHLIFYTGSILQDSAKKNLAKQSPKDIVVLENLRFYPGEEQNDAVLAKKLAALADVYVNDAFSVCHRAQASVVAVAKLLPKYAGLVIEREVKFLSAVLKNVKKPFVVLMGGIKISEKAATIENLAKHADQILLGGGLANLFLEAQGLEIGHSKVERKELKMANGLLKTLKHKLLLPVQ